MRVLFHATWMAALVLFGTFALALVVALGAPRADNCGRACYAPGVTENPDITLIGQ